MKHFLDEHPLALWLVFATTILLLSVIIAQNVFQEEVCYGDLQEVRPEVRRDVVDEGSVLAGGLPALHR